MRTWIAVGGIGAALFLWGTSGWHPLTLAVAVAANLAAVLAPRGLRARAGPCRAGAAWRGRLAGLAALIAAARAQWPVLVVMGLALAGMALHPRGARYRAPLWVAASLVAAAGAVGMAVASFQEQARIEAEARAAGDFSRAQMLADNPDDAVEDVLIAAASVDLDRWCGFGFDEPRARRVRRRLPRPGLCGRTAHRPRADHRSRPVRQPDRQRLPDRHPTP